METRESLQIFVAIYEAMLARSIGIYEAMLARSIGIYEAMLARSIGIYEAMLACLLARSIEYLWIALPLFEEMQQLHLVVLWNSGVWESSLHGILEMW